MIHAHQTAPTQFVNANGIHFAYRRFGKAGGVPLVFNQHYIGTMDYWDPAVTDGLARDREVILFNNAGVSSSSGEVPTTFEQMGANAIAFSRGERSVDAVWTYEAPHAAVAAIRDHVAFYPDRVDAIEEQPGG
jgi:pimeloyl-ACP methyl ester carboxylesterase